MSSVTINIAKDYTRYPAGRYRTDGIYSGERFRDDVLIQRLRDGNVTVVLDGTMGFGSSFLEETFGGLVRQGLSIEELEARLNVVAKDQSLVDEVWEYIHAAG